MATRLGFVQLSTVAFVATASLALKAGSGGAPLGLRWGMSPVDVQAYFVQRGFKFVGPSSPADLDQFLYEQRWEGEVLGHSADHVAPLFFAGELFGLAASWSPSPEEPASRIWERAVERLTVAYGKPTTIQKPIVLMSAEAVIRLIPPGYDKAPILAILARAATDKELARNLVLDLEILAKLWVPEAAWQLKDGGVIRAVMRAKGENASGLTDLKPAVVWTRGVP